MFNGRASDDQFCAYHDGLCRAAGVARNGGSGALLWQQAWEDCPVEVLSSRVMLRPADLDRSRRFYRDVLGLAVYREFGAAGPGCPRRARPPGRSRGPRRPGVNAGAVGPGRDVDRGSRRRLNRAGGGPRWPPAAPRPKMTRRRKRARIEANSHVGA